ncbi:hypothetical protein, partial [Stenotrophomonas sp. SrG]|uniref:hypothetical protein n=1 Tax=Stenotrophomonas sp. SrG TaxID=3414430 RepID=UPI003CF70229
YDRILNLGAADSGSDIIRIGGGLTRAMIQSTQITGDDLIIGFFVGGAYQALVLDGFLSSQNGSHIIEFADGTWLSAQDFRRNQHSWIGTA